VKTENTIPNRPIAWEEAAPAESRFRRVQQSAPQPGRALPGMPLEMEDPEEDELPRKGATRPGGSRFDGPRGRWWRPASGVRRVFLLLSILIVLSGLTASAFLLKTWLSRDGRFRINGADDIEATGLTEVSRAQMLPVFGEDIGRNIFFVPLGERRRQLEEIPWIERATVMRLLPNRIRVSVVERQPVAFARQGQQIGLVDANGVLLAMPAAMMTQQHYSFPVVTGIDAGDSSDSRKARMKVFLRLLAELDANGQKLSTQISEIDLTDPEDARVLMPEQGADVLAHFGEDHFLERYKRYRAHISEWRQQYPKLEAVDLRYERQAVLEMAAGTDVAQAAADQQNAASAGQDKSADSETAGVAEVPTGRPPSAGKSTGAPTERSSSAARKVGAKPGRTTSMVAGRAVESKTASQVKSVKKAGQRDGRSSAKPKSSPKKELRRGKVKVKETRRVADLKSAALNTSKRRNPLTAPPATSAGEGQ
jgi:cell division protein FtsQ